MRVVEHASDVQCLVIVEDPHLGALGGELSRRRLGLHEVRDDLSPGPDRIVQDAIEGKVSIGTQKSRDGRG